MCITMCELAYIEEGGGDVVVNVLCGDNEDHRHPFESRPCLTLHRTSLSGVVSKVMCTGKRGGYHSYQVSIYH